MKKYVYLFELDSVRNTDREIEIGQKTLYDEIVSNGNIVVLTFNQLVDSRGFFSLLDNQDYYNNIVSLFESGSIRISQFGDIRTISQYLLNSFEYEKEFIYSGWPLKSTQKRLLALIRRSLTYSDLSEINDYRYSIGNRTDKEVLDLFVEVNKNKEILETSLDIQSCFTILENIYWLLKIVLRLSSMHSIYIPPRDSSEYSNLRLHNILEIIENLSCVKNDSKLGKAFDIIKSLKCYGSDKRSDYLHCLVDYNDEHEDGYRLDCQYAEAITNLAYNYACEISICNISKHYNLDELTIQHGERTTFEFDFITRLKEYWELNDYDNRFLLRETNDYIEYSPNKKSPDFSKAVRLNKYISNLNNDKLNEIQRYESNLKRQQLKHKSKLLGAISKRIVFSLICFLMAWGVEVVSQMIQGALDNTVNLNALWWIAIETFTFICMTEILSSVFSYFLKKCFHIEFLTFSEALGEIGKLLRDVEYIISQKSKTYFNPCPENRDCVEKISKATPIRFVSTASMKRYLKFRASKDGSLFFSESDVYPDVYPIAETDNEYVVEELERLEELFDYQFGVVYKSKYNMLLVDPVAKNSEAQMYYPYERIIPTAGSGVVMVTKCKDKFVLLKQYRHAPRKIQYSFPRGYGENGIFSVNNAKKELAEELKAEISEEPKLLGRISPDSGLTSSCVYAYFVNIKSYKKTSEEGILDVDELSEVDFENKIATNSNNAEDGFDDGFTLAAYMLYKLWKSRGNIS